MSNTIERQLIDLASENMFGGREKAFEDATRLADLLSGFDDYSRSAVDDMLRRFTTDLAYRPFGTPYDIGKSQRSKAILADFSSAAISLEKLLRSGLEHSKEAIQMLKSNESLFKYTPSTPIRKEAFLTKLATYKKLIEPFMRVASQLKSDQEKQVARCVEATQKHPTGMAELTFIWTAAHDEFTAIHGMAEVSFGFYSEGHMDEVTFRENLFYVSNCLRRLRIFYEVLVSQIQKHFNKPIPEPARVRDAEKQRMINDFVRSLIGDLEYDSSPFTSILRAELVVSFGG